MKLHMLMDYWDVINIDGHSFEELLGAFEDFRRRRSRQPLVIIADTIKGKGVSFMERNIIWHHTVPTDGNLKIAREKLAFNKKGENGNEYSSDSIRY